MNLFQEIAFEIYYGFDEGHYKDLHVFAGGVNHFVEDVLSDNNLIVFTLDGHKHMFEHDEDEFNEAMFVRLYPTK